MHYNTPKTFTMKDQLIFFLSAYLLFALFVSIYLFTANILAEGMAGVFGICLIVTPVYTYKNYLKDIFLNLKYHFARIIRFFSAY
jgi:hypothetical protein